MLSMFQAWLATRTNEEEGQGLVEYALILVLVSIVVIAALLILGEEVNEVFDQIGSVLQTNNP